MVAGKNNHSFINFIGIIIDRFADLRGIYKKIKNCKENYCFICGFDKDKLEKNSGSSDSWNRHIKVLTIKIINFNISLVRPLYVELYILLCFPLI